MKNLARILVAVTALLLLSSELYSQYVSSYNNSFTGPNTNRAKEEAYNRQMRDEQEKWRQKKYAEEQRASRGSSSYNYTGTKEKKPVTPATKTINTPEPKKSKYDYVSTYIDGLAEAGLKGKSGFIDRSENEVVPVIYDLVHIFWEGLAAVKLNGKYGFVDMKGKVKIPLIYDHAWRFEGGKAIVMLNKKETLINSQGMELFPFKYDNVYPLSDGWVQVWLNKKIGFVDILGKVLITPKYDSVIYLVSGGKKMFLGGNGYYFSKDGKPMMNVYDWIGDTDDEGRASVYLNGKYGRIDQKGKVILPLIYDNLMPGDNGMTGICKKDKWGFVNDEGRQVIPVQFDSVLINFNEKGIAVVKNGKQMFSINKAGDRRPDSSSP
jgi:hypothetical protein